MIHVADAVGELIRQQTLRIHYLPGDPNRYYTARAPSLLDQLADAVTASTTGRGGRTVPGSRLPLDASAVDLLVAIVTTIHTWARTLGQDRHGPPSTVLRRVSTTIVASSDHDDLARLVQRRCWCGQTDITPADCGRCWTHRIRAMLTPDATDREIRGAACWSCKTKTIDPVTGTELWEPTTTTVLDQDGERLRVPAIVVRVAALPDTGHTDDLWIYRMCRACGTEGWLDYTTTTAA